MTILYDHIGQQYDTTRRADPGIVALLAEGLALDIDRHYLDMACGTGNYTCALADVGGHWYGIDQSLVMLDAARGKSRSVKWLQGNALATSLPDRQFDGISCILAAHHFADLSAACKEMARLLKPGGRLVIFTSTPEQMQGYWLNHYFPEMMQASCQQMPSLARFHEVLLQAGFTLQREVPFFITPELEDFFLYSGKQRPKMYLSSSVRSGISSFQQLCEDAELQRGIHLLREDIASGEIEQVIANYANNQGDYLILQAQLV